MIHINTYKSIENGSQGLKNFNSRVQYIGMKGTFSEMYPPLKYTSPQISLLPPCTQHYYLLHITPGLENSSILITK